MASNFYPIELRVMDTAAVSEDEETTRNRLALRLGQTAAPRAH